MRPESPEVPAFHNLSAEGKTAWAARKGARFEFNSLGEPLGHLSMLHRNDLLLHSPRWARSTRSQALRCSRVELVPLLKRPLPSARQRPYPHRSRSSLGSVGSVTGEKAICEPRVDGRQSGSQVESSNVLKNSAKSRFRSKAHGSIRIQEGEPKNSIG